MEPSKPKSLAQALAAHKAPVEHPDADVLSAFVENSLLPRERETVMGHLAVCAECREVTNLLAMDQTPARHLELVAAAAPMSAARTEGTAVSGDRVDRAKRRAWLPWAAAAAACLAIVSIVTARYGQKKAEQNGAVPSQTATVAEPPRTIAVNAPPPAPVPGAAMEQTQRDRKQSQKPATKDRLDLAAAPEKRALGGQAQSRSAEARSQPEVSAKMTQDALSATNQAVQLEQQQIMQEATTNADAMQRREQVQAAQAQAAPPAAAPRAVAPAFGTLTKSARAEFDGRARWRISEDGHLERELGAGSWQAVLTSENNRMRVVSVAGRSVWVGGENEALYRSQDEGATWQKVALPEKNGSAHVIAHIRFENSTTGAIEAEDGTGWATADGGATWK